MSKKICTISDPFDGYFNGVPYTVDEYRESMYFDISSEEIDKARDIKNVTDKLVYMFLLALSDGTTEHFGNMLFVRISVEDVANRLGLTASEAAESFGRLISAGRLLVIELDKEADVLYYAAV